MMKNKKFDCIKMKYDAQEIIYREIKDMTPEEELSYWNKVHRKFRNEFNNQRQISPKRKL